MRFSTLAAVTAFVGQTFALGINCRGSGLCSAAGGSLDDVKSYVDGIQPRDRFYNGGQQIACDAYLCAFFQNGASGTAEQASTLLQELHDHGCRNCGSAPTSGNDVSNGELTVNYVDSPSCNGAC